MVGAGTLELEAGNRRTRAGRSCVDVVSARLWLVDVERHHLYGAIGRHQRPKVAEFTTCGPFITPGKNTSYSNQH